MIQTTINVEDQLGPALEKLGNPENGDKIVMKIIRIMGNDFRRNIKTNYLQGQLILDRGQLAKSLFVTKKKGTKNTVVVSSWKLANIYNHPGGYTILPKKGKLLIFRTSDGRWCRAKEIHGEARPFIITPAERFPWAIECDAATQKVIQKEFADRGMA